MKRPKAHTLMDQQTPDGVGRIALFVDFDNAWFGLQGTGTKGATAKTIARSLLALARRFGAVAVSKVYSGEPRRIPGMRETFSRQGYDVIAADNPRKGTDIK